METEASWYLQEWIVNDNTCIKDSNLSSRQMASWQARHVWYVHNKHAHTTSHCVFVLAYLGKILN